MKGTFWLKGKKVTLFIGDPTKVPEATMELESPQIQIDGDRVVIIESPVPPNAIKK